MSRTLVLLDGHSLLFRAFFGMPISMTSPEGIHTNAVYGFLAILRKVMEEEKPDYLAAAFDLPSPTFRHELYHDYKGNRRAAPDEFREQVPVIREVLAHMGIPVITREGWEADDILGTLACKGSEEGCHVVVISGDRDLLQIAGPDTEIVIPKTKGGQTVYERYDPEEVRRVFGVSPEKFIELKALMGDSSDNIPGLPGVGPKTAQKIMETYGSIEEARRHIDEIKPKKAMEAMRDHYDDLMLSLTLVTIRKDAPVDFDPEAFKAGSFYHPGVYEDFRRLGFKSFLDGFEETKEELLKPVEAETENDPGKIRELFEQASRALVRGVSIIREDGKLLAAGLAFDEKITVFVPGNESEESGLSERLKELAEAPDGVTCCMNVKEFLREYPVREPGGFFDNIVAAYLLDPLKSDWDAASIATACLGVQIPSRRELLGRKPVQDAEDPDMRSKIIQCAAREADAALRSKPVLEERLLNSGMDRLFKEVEMPLTEVLASMEREGIHASREELLEYGSKLENRIKELENRIYEEAGEKFNLNSPKQLGVILFEKMELPGGKKTKTGYSTAADVLEKLAEEYPIAADILEYRTYSKLKSTYADGLPAYIREDGKIHTSFNQTVTATGRLSSADPNLQNIPMREDLGRRIRKCFYPSPGCIFVDADYSQIELRILAHMSGDEKLIDAYRQEKDIHRITASQVFHIPFEEVTDRERRNAKAVNFGIVYGISSFGLSQGLDISRKEAQEYIKKYFETYPGIRKFLDELVSSAKETGYAVSLFGRRRPVPELKSQNFMQRSFGERVAMNSPIQGTAADIMKIAMIRVYRRLKKECPSAVLLLQIHDELLVEVPREFAGQVQTIVSEEMKQAAELKVALETDCHTGEDWYEAK